jgi:plastocyanin
MKPRRLVRPTFSAFAALAGLFQVACGSSSGTMVGPTPGGGGGSASVTISIVGMAGSQSFSPNPATVPIGQTVAFKNTDAITHHIQQDNGAFDTGDLAPGATSAPIMIDTAGALPYHCVIHPSMVGSINGSASGPTGGPGY